MLITLDAETLIVEEQNYKNKLFLPDEVNSRYNDE